MELYKDEFAFKNNTKKNNIKKKYTALKFAIVAFALTFGPSIGRGITRSIKESGKEYELSQRDEMYDIIVKNLKEIGMESSIIAIRFIDYMINNGYFTVENKIEKHYSLVDSAGYNLIIGNPDDESYSDIFTRALNDTFENVEAYTVRTQLTDKSEESENKTSEYMCLICDGNLGFNYLYWPSNHSIIIIPSITNFTNGSIEGSISIASEYIRGNLTISDLIKIGNNNNSKSYPNMDRIEDYADAKIVANRDKMEDTKKLLIKQKFAIEFKEVNGRDPE